MFVLPTGITVYNVEDVLEEFNRFIQSEDFTSGNADVVLIDASNLEDLDGSGLQLLLSIYKTSKQRNLPFTMLGMTEEIVNLLKITGTREILGNEG